MKLRHDASLLRATLEQWGDNEADPQDPVDRVSGTRPPQADSHIQAISRSAWQRGWGGDNAMDDGC